MEMIKVWQDGLSMEVPREFCYFTDRSRQKVQCDRRRFFDYHGGPLARGVEGVRKSEDLVLGSAVHWGLEKLLLGESPESAGIEAYSYLIDNSPSVLVQDDLSIQETVPEVFELLIEEQARLAQGLVYAFGKRHLSALLDKYEIVSLEEEINWLLWETRFSLPDAKEERYGVMMSRPDAILRDRQTGGMYTVSYKTIKDFGEATLEGLVTQSQNFTEGLAMKHRYGQEPSGTIYLYFLKGAKYKDKEFGWKRYTSSLVRPWMNEQMGSHEFGSVGMEYEWFDGSQTRRLGKAFKKVNAWEAFDFDEWLSALDLGKVDLEKGRDWLEEQVADPAIVAWDASFAERWLEGAKAREREWDNWLRNDPDRLLLDERARLDEDSCFGKYGKKCPHFETCWLGRSLDERMRAGRLRVREGNHKEEFGDGI